LAFTTTTGAGGTSLIGTSGVDTASVAGNTFALYIGAQAANDAVSLTGTTANIRVELGKGADTFSAGALSSSTISGNYGNDVIALDAAAAIDVTALVNGNQGADTITIGATSAVTLKSGAKVLGGADNDTITVTRAVLSSGSVINGNKGEDTITLGTAVTFNSATIFGGEGNDTMSSAGAIAAVFSGDDGSDTLTGSTAADTLFGGEGNDLIKSGAAIDSSKDSLIGGSGVDTFEFVGNYSLATTGASVSAATAAAAGGVADVITDFESTDKIKLAAATSFGGANQTATGMTVGSIYAISGTLNSDGTFTQASIAAGGFDTLIGVAAAATTIDVDNAVVIGVLKGVLATSITSSNFTT